MTSSLQPRPRSSASDLPTQAVTQADAYARLAEVYDEIVVDQCYPQWAQYLHELWSTDDEPVRTVLDVCCGTGLMAQQLLAVGYSVTGTDASQAMLDRARTLLGSRVALIHASLPSIGTTRLFDAAISTFDGLNYLTPDAFAASLHSIAGRLRAGGWLCFDLHTDAMLEFTLKNADITGEDEGYRFTIHSDVEPLARTCDTSIDVRSAHDDSQFTEHHRQYFHSDEAVTLALQTAGFGAISVVDEYSPAPATADSLRATWIARRL